MVVGPPGEEIWPDKYGRVKVQFFWDRYGQEGRQELLLDPLHAGLGRPQVGLHVDSRASARKWSSPTWKATPTGR